MSFLPSWAQSCTSLGEEEQLLLLGGPPLEPPGPQQLRWGAGRGSHWAYVCPLFVIYYDF